LTEHRLLTSISTFSLYPLPLRAALPLIRRAGFDGVELVAPPVVHARIAARLAELVRRHGLAVLSVHQTLFGYGPLLPLERRARDAVALALAVGAPRIVLHSPHVRAWAQPAGERWLETLAQLQKQAAAAGACISIENVDWNPRLDKPVVLGEMHALAGFAARRGLGVTLDTCHAMRSHADLLESYKALGPQMVNVHLSDWRDIGAGERRLVQRSLMANHLLPGQGQAPLAALLRRLAADGYAGPVTLEVNPWALRPWSPAQCLGRLEQAVAYIRQAGQGSAPQGA
jgi:sugar phosphate isomerase/epimerase